MARALRVIVRVCSPLLLAVMLSASFAAAEPSRRPANENLDIDRRALAKTLASLEDQRQSSSLLSTGTLDAVAHARSPSAEAQRRPVRTRIAPSLRLTRTGFRAVLVAVF